MPQEIERKYLVRLHPAVPARTRIIESVYLSVSPEVRVARYRGVAGSYQLTFKRGEGLVREEEIINIYDAQGSRLFDMADGATVVTKVRDDFDVEHPDFITRKKRWEVDTYMGRHTGLVVAEVELKYAEEEAPIPHFLTILQEVTDDPMFKNKRLSRATDNEISELVFRYNTLDEEHAGDA